MLFIRKSIMCGIFAVLNEHIHSGDTIHQKFVLGNRRGPEHSQLNYYSGGALFLGFHRLAINGLDELSNQPLYMDNITLICNGEIYNCKQLYTHMGITPKTGSDCEVIIHLYKRYGMKQTLTMLDGVFAFILYEHTPDQEEPTEFHHTLYIARDPLGVRPLYVLYDRYGEEPIGFASEMKCLLMDDHASKMSEDSAHEKKDNDNNAHRENRPSMNDIRFFQPGTYSVLHYNGYQWETNVRNHSYYVPSLPFPQFISSVPCATNECEQFIYNALEQAVYKRCELSERPIACLLSGGLDSSAVAALAARYFRRKGKGTLETYSIGLSGSVDLTYARQVADYIQSKHTEIVVTEDEMFDAIPEVIQAIETYDTTTVRASLGNYLVSKYISKHSEAKVILNGDGADELFGGYLYMNYCKDSIEFDRETRRLLRDIHMFDVLRSDKCISSNGLEPRTPFLDRTLVNYVLSLPIEMRNHNLWPNSISKRLLRSAITECGNSLLPFAVLNRPKEAFSDGVTNVEGRSLPTILQEKIIQNHPELLGNVGVDIEKSYYLSIFDAHYPHCRSIIPYYWMPKYTEETSDPSARTLHIYMK